MSTAVSSASTFSLPEGAACPPVCYATALCVYELHETTKRIPIRKIISFALQHGNRKWFKCVFRTNFQK